MEAVGGMCGGAKRYKSGWKADIPKKPGYRLAQVNGEPVYLKKKGRKLSGYSLFISEFKKKNPNVKGPEYMKKASVEWKGLSVAKQGEYKTRASKMGFYNTGSPNTVKLSEKQKKKLNVLSSCISKKSSRSSSRSRSRSASRSSRSRSASRSSRKSSSRKSSSRKSSSRKSSSRKSSRKSSRRSSKK